MNAPRTILVLSAVSLLLVLAAPAALAGPARVHVGIGVGVGVPVAPPVVVRPRGHYETHIERVWVPGELVGYDVYGHPVTTRGYWTERRVRVWVPHRAHLRHAHRAHRVVRPAPYVGFGFSYVR